MADFTQALKLTLNAEGGWCNDPKDPGGETYCGISRKNWPQWPGWAVIHPKGAAAPVLTDPALPGLVAGFYRPNFWERVQGDALNVQADANAVFDAAVNTSVREATLLAQRAAGVADDGVFGPQTVAAINSHPDFLPRFRAERAVFYARLYGKDPDRFGGFLESWMARATL